MTGALIVTAGLGASDFARLDAQRRRYFPPERNLLSAHLTMFHALPPSAEDEARSLFARLAVAPAPAAEISGLINLGRGVAYAVRSPRLEDIRRRIAEHFRGLLTAQDANRWRPHVTVQNKVDPSRSRALLAELSASFRPRSLRIEGIALHRYLGGPWEPLGSWPFRG
ncbi:2'-5' RNA ligase family protein [Sphingomonas sp. ASV193]|uniref:2'-5' RNA ligase family protein n=1 Tax=Sphingomonas sp. ASV193 TaxID=3144405 RepID=UPI0032E8E239